MNHYQASFGARPLHQAEMPAGKGYRNLFCRWAVWILVVLAGPTNAASFVIARPDESPSQTMLAVQARVVAAYKSIGIQTEVIGLPALRSAAYVKQDKVDAELLRVDVPARNNRFVRVNAPLLVYDVVALGRTAGPKIVTPEDLHGRHVGILQGIWAQQDAAKHAAQIEHAPSYESLIKMLNEGHIDVALMLTTDAAQLAHKLQHEWAVYHVVMLNPKITSYTAYHFISPRHANLAQRLAEAFARNGLPLKTIDAPP